MFGKAEDGQLIMYKRDHYKLIANSTGAFIAFPVNMQDGMMVMDRENSRPLTESMWKESLEVEY